MARRVSCLLKSHRKTLLLAAGLMVMVGPVFGQGGAPAAKDEGGKPLAFDVISVKPSKSQSMWWRTTPDGFHAGGAIVWSLMMSAYGILPDQLVDLPGWATSDRFDIQAKMDEETAAAWNRLPRNERSRRLALMEQALLAGRFQLKVHHETRNLRVYDLVIAKGGLKIKESPANVSSYWTMGGGRLGGKGIGIDSFIFSLSGAVGRFIVNKTGLSGKYDFTLKWTPDGMPETADSGPSIFAALQEQLGLQLVPAKAPFDVIVVDHIERPSHN